MRKSLFYWATILLVFSLSVVTACNKDEKEDPVTVGISADSIFSETGEATLTVSLSQAAGKDVSVSLRGGERGPVPA